VGGGAKSEPFIQIDGVGDCEPAFQRNNAKRENRQLAREDGEKARNVAANLCEQKYFKVFGNSSNIGYPALENKAVRIVPCAIFFH